MYLVAFERAHGVYKLGKGHYLTILFYYFCLYATFPTPSGYSSWFTKVNITTSTVKKYETDNIRNKKNVEQNTLVKKSHLKSTM